MQRVLRVRILRSAMLAALVTASAAGAADPMAVRTYEDAVSRYNAGDIKGAFIQLKNSLRADPSQLPARVLMGRIQLDLHFPKQAEEELLLAGKLGADPALLALPLAQARNQQGKYKEVTEELRPPEYPAGIRADLWVELGKARLGEGDHPGAGIAFDEALKLVPHHPEALLSRAGDLIERNLFDEAAPLVADVLGRDPENAEALFLQGVLYEARRDYENAVATFRHVQRVDAEHRRAALGEALALLAGSRQDEGLAKLAQIVETQRFALEANYFYAKELKTLGRDAEAKVILARAAELVNKLTPEDLAGNPGQLFLAAMVTFENGQYESAYQFLDKYLEREPTDLKANKLLTKLLLRIGKPTDALRLLTRLKVNNPNDVELLVMLGDVNANLHDFLAAERYYQAALERVEGDSALIERLGLSQLNLGETDSAIRTLGRLVDRESTNSGARLFLGFLHLSNGRVDEARALVDEVVANQPDNLVARNLQAAIAISSGQRDDGRRLLRAIVQEAPEFKPARLNLIRLDILERNYAAAAQTVEALLAETPDDPALLREYAQIVAVQGDRRTAITRLEHLRELDPRAVRPLLELVDLYLAEGLYSDALKVALALDREVPDSLLVKQALARVQLMRGEPVVAQSLLNDAAQLARYDADQLVSVAALQVRARALEAAEENLRKALELRPGSVKAHLQLATLLAGQQRYAEAGEEAAAARDRNPKNVAAAALLGEIRLAQGRAGEAAQLYREALSLSDRAELVVRLHHALVIQGQAAQALVELRAWNEAHPDEPVAMIVLADHLEQTGDTTTALQLYRRLVELAPQSFVVHNNLANLLMPLDAEQALTAALRAHELAPENAAVLDTLGWVWVQLGELDRGLAQLREAVARDSRSPSIRYHLAVALEEYGNKTEARRELRRALDLGVPFAERALAEQRLQRLELE